MKTQLVYDENNLPFALNPDNRCPTILILDSSYSMSSNGRITKLNEGVERVIDNINSDVLAKRRVDIAIVRVSNSTPELIQPFITVQDICENSPIPKFVASGGTPMEQGLCLALDELEQYKAKLKDNGIQYYKPMIFVLTDGEFYISRQTLDKLHKSEESNGHVIFPVGVGSDVNVSDLISISSKGRVFLLDDTNFSDLFEFMSSSLASVSQSSPGDKLSVTIPDSMKIVERKEIDL